MMQQSVRFVCNMYWVTKPLGVLLKCASWRYFRSFMILPSTIFPPAGFRWVNSGVREIDEPLLQGESLDFSTDCVNLDF